MESPDDMVPSEWEIRDSRSAPNYSAPTFMQSGRGPAVTKLMLALIALVAIVLTSPNSVGAAELAAPTVSRAPAYRGPCGCLQVAYTYHPELQSTYGIGFDPRN
jgi:hypothetical protein